MRVFSLKYHCILRLFGIYTENTLEIAKDPINKGTHWEYDVKVIETRHYIFWIKVKTIKNQLTMIGYHQNNTTSTGELIISHSHLNKLDPNSGGHPRVFYKTLTAPEVIESPSFDKGDLLHHWMEHKDSYVISEQNKPTDAPAAFAEEFHELYTLEKWRTNAMFLHAAQQNTKVEKEVFSKYTDLYKILTGKETTEADLSLFIACLRYARTEADYNKKLLEPTVLAHFEAFIPYLKFLKEANGMIILTPANRDLLENCKQSLSEHPFASKLIFAMHGKHEEEFYWTKTYNGITINRKAKIDKYIVDDINKVLTIIDLKTTGYPVASFTKFDVGAYWKYNLGRQLTSYKEAFFAKHKEYNEAEWTINLFNIVVQTNDQFPVMVYKTSHVETYKFKKQLADLEARAAYHIENNQWNLTMEEAQQKGEECITI